ncbi:MAG: hypothetical protein NZ922_05585 [Candidatus Methanomethyliaceae archaeon]|nr:hypothetical protein [Candidatus Methanomethyliaceae archaeon]MDW7971238.1 radical SAM protein [Nitrososphaerota archaeon]
MEIRVVETRKNVVHGWYFPYSSGRRECNSERILINPYNGCSVNCPMCYTRSYGGYFDDWNREGIITVFKDIHKKLEEELSKLYYASCGYFSPTTDPFQYPVEDMYHLSELCMNVFLELDLPIEFITKNGARVPDRIFRKMSEHKYGHCFCQYTILSLDEEISKILSPGASMPKEQLKAVRKSKDYGLYTVVRIDPIVPGINDSENMLSELIEAVKDNGADHIIASVCDLSKQSMEKMLPIVENLRLKRLWQSLYVEKIGMSYHACLKYRRNIFSIIRKICKDNGLTFALCMEFYKLGKEYRGMNEEFMTSKVCEGKIVPMYFRRSLKEKFKPIPKCDGDCLSCAKSINYPHCDKPILAEAGSMTLRKYLKLKPDACL